MFTHIHGTGLNVKKKKDGHDSLEKIRISFRILPRYNSQDFTEQLTLEEFKTVKYAVCVRHHFQGIEGTDYYLTDFSDNDFQPVFIQKLKNFLEELCNSISWQDIYEKSSSFPLFEYESADDRFYIHIKPDEIKNKDGTCLVRNFSIFIKSNFWKTKGKKERITQKFTFTVSCMELRSALYQFIKENDYKPEPYTLRFKMYPSNLECYKQSKKEKPILLVDVRTLFFEKYDYHAFYGDLWKFDEKISEYFNPEYIWSGENISNNQMSLLFAHIHKELYFNTTDYSNPGNAQCFYISRNYNSEFADVFNQFYAVTFLLYTGNLNNILKIGENLYDTLIAKYECAFKRDYVPAFNKNSNVFEVNKKALENLSVMERRYITEYDDIPGSCENYFYDYDAPEGLYFSFVKRDEEIVMVGVFPEDRWLYQYWSRYSKIFFEYTGSIPDEIITFPGIWYHEEWDDIDECSLCDEADALSFGGMYNRYVDFDKLDEEEFDQEDFLEDQEWEDWRNSLTPEDNEWFFPDFYEDVMLFGKTKINVIEDKYLPKNCFVIKG